MRSSRDCQLAFAKLVIEALLAVAFLALAFVVLAWGEPTHDTPVIEFRVSDLERRLRTIEETRPHNLTRLALVEQQTSRILERLDRLDRLEVGFLFMLGGFTLSGSGVLTWRIYRRMKDGS